MLQAALKKNTEEDEEDIEENTTSHLAAKEISMHAAVATVLPTGFGERFDKHCGSTQLARGR